MSGQPADGDRNMSANQWWDTETQSCCILLLPAFYGIFVETSFGRTRLGQHVQCVSMVVGAVARSRKKHMASRIQSLLPAAAFSVPAWLFRVGWCEKHALNLTCLYSFLILCINMRMVAANIASKTSERAILSF